MRICVIGAGFVGLTCALRLSKMGHEVTVIEKEGGPGGLAIGFKDKKWRWPLEKHYHHLFTSDWAIRNLAQEVGHKISFRRPKTSTYFGGNIYQLDSPISLLRFPHLGILDKIRTSAALLYLRLTPRWESLEKVTSRRFLKSMMGENTWRVLWDPLFSKKFGKYAKQISASWFWARVKKRSASLGYPEGGFESLAKSVEKMARKSGAKFLYNTGVSDIKKKAGKLEIIADNGGPEVFDKIICTLPTPLFFKITKGLPRNYKNRFSGLLGLGAVNLVLALKTPLLRDGTYWLNVNEPGFPFLAVVEHTSFGKKSQYGGDHIVYVGNYLEPTHLYFSKTAEQLLREFSSYLKKISPHFSLGLVRKSWVFKAPFAQPVVGKNYSRKIPPLKTPINGLYLANIQQVYPWDRGTNYAVELGNRVSKLVDAEIPS
mgnify:CR=1 FL=1